MVWGVVVPSSFGDFRPEGNFVGWEERLEAYYHRELADGPLKAHMPRASFYRSRVLRKCLYELGDPMPDGFRVERPLPHEWPEDYRTAKTHDTLGSLIEIDGFLAVDERLKALIEAIEPGVHEFRPIRITMPRGKDYLVPYHVLLIGQFRHSFRPELSTDGAWYGSPAITPSMTRRRLSRGPRCHPKRLPAYISGANGISTGQNSVYRTDCKTRSPRRVCG